MSWIWDSYIGIIDGMNKKNETVRAGPGYRKLDKQELPDLTDKENPEFVYIL